MWGGGTVTLNRELRACGVGCEQNDTAGAAYALQKHTQKGFRNDRLPCIMLLSLPHCVRTEKVQSTSWFHALPMRLSCSRTRSVFDSVLQEKVCI